MLYGRFYLFLVHSILMERFRLFLEPNSRIVFVLLLTGLYISGHFSCFSCHAFARNSNHMLSPLPSNVAEQQHFSVRDGITF